MCTSFSSFSKVFYFQTTNFFITFQTTLIVRVVQEISIIGLSKGHAYGIISRRLLYHSCNMDGKTSFHLAPQILRIPIPHAGYRVLTNCLECSVIVENFRLRRISLKLNLLLVSLRNKMYTYKEIFSCYYLFLSCTFCVLK